MPRGKHDSTPLERRMRHEQGWPLPRENATCQRCRDAGWFILPAHGTQAESTWRCDCAAGETAPKGLPRWREPKAREPLPPDPPRGGADRAAGADEE